jgi:hypothetical protein
MSGRDLRFLFFRGGLVRNNRQWQWAHHASSGGGTPRDVQIFQSASLELINETVHPQILPAAGPRFLHGRRTGNVLDLGADARLDNLRHRFGIGNTLEAERPGECGERREPARERRRRFGRRGAGGHGFEACRSPAAIRVADDKN